MKIIIFDRTDAGVYQTPVGSVEEGFELLETSGMVPQLLSSTLWAEGRIAGAWERGKKVIDLRSVNG